MQEGQRAMGRSHSWDNKLDDPLENGLSNYILAPADGNISCTNSASDRVESSSTGHNPQERTCNSNQPMEDINLSISSGSKHLSHANHLEQLNPRNLFGRSRVSPVFFSSTNVPGIAEIPARDFALRSNLGQHESIPRHSSVNVVSARWIRPPRMESESCIRSSPFVIFPLASTSSDETAIISHGQYQSPQRSEAFLTDTRGDDVRVWNGFAAVERRHRQIRRVLNAVRRDDHLRAEIVDALAELHDQHSDLRLDVDNMSYEELLALEEGIGIVGTGLSEEKIRGSTKQRKYEAVDETVANLEPCCICQEDYNFGDEIGRLECGHEFHTNCIEEWLKLKNMCPLCKMMAL